MFLPRLFDRFDRFYSLDRVDDVFNSFFKELRDASDDASHNGERCTYVNGMLVKKELSDGTIEHYENGRLHSSFGPAVEKKKEGDSEYWLYGKKVSLSEFKDYKKKLESEKRDNYNLNLTSEEKEKIEKMLGRKI